MAQRKSDRNVLDGNSNRGLSTWDDDGYRSVGQIDVQQIGMSVCIDLVP
jgi:hypothetical protein